MQNDEILIVQNYLRETFSNDEIQIRKSDSDTNPVSYTHLTLPTNREV